MRLGIKSTYSRVNPGASSLLATSSSTSTTLRPVSRYPRFIPQDVPRRNRRRPRAASRSAALSVTACLFHCVTQVVECARGRDDDAEAARPGNERVEAGDIENFVVFNYSGERADFHKQCLQFIQFCGHVTLHAEIVVLARTF